MERGKLAVYRPPSAQGPGRVSANRFVKPEVIVPGPAFQRKIVRGAMGPCTLIDLTSRFQLGQRSNAVSTSRTACEEATISISLAPTTGACELISAGDAAARILLAKVSHFCISFEESDRVLDPRGARQAAAATRRNSTSVMLIPGAAQLVTGGAASRACSSVSNRTIEKPWPSTGSSQ
jgi:hypothetical protein